MFVNQKYEAFSERIHGYNTESYNSENREARNVKKHVAIHQAEIEKIDQPADKKNTESDNMKGERPFIETFA
jgi:cell division protein FtsB